MFSPKQTTLEQQFYMEVLEWLLKAQWPKPRLITDSLNIEEKEIPKKQNIGTIKVLSYRKMYRDTIIFTAFKMSPHV